MARTSVGMGMVMVVVMLMTTMPADDHSTEPREETDMYAPWTSVHAGKHVKQTCGSHQVAWADLERSPFFHMYFCPVFKSVEKLGFPLGSHHPAPTLLQMQESYLPGPTPGHLLTWWEQVLW